MCKKELIFFTLALFMGCSTIEKTEKKQWKPAYRIQAGINKAGVIYHFGDNKK